MDQVAEMLQELAGTLGVAVEHLWAVVVWQAQIGAARSFMWALLIAVGMVVYFKKLKPWILALEEDDPAEEQFNQTFAPVAGFFIVLIGVPVMCNNLYWAVARLLNPEFFALRYILAVLR